MVDISELECEWVRMRVHYTCKSGLQQKYDEQCKAKQMKDILHS